MITKYSQRLDRHIDTACMKHETLSNDCLSATTVYTICMSSIERQFACILIKSLNE